MRNPFMKKWLAATLCTLALGSTAALAEPDTFYLGTGRNNALTVAGSNTVVNSYGRVTNAPMPGEDLLVADNVFCPTAPCFSEGDLVMVLQTTGIVPEPASGNAGPFDLSNDAVGRWELARVRMVSVSGTTTLTLTAPLLHAYTANVTQVIRVPEYTDVTINSGATLKAQSWNGRIGGVLAFLATGRVQNSGTLTASGAGFRGGFFVNDGSGKAACTLADEPAPSGAQKGEGIASTRFGDAHTGLGNVANGGGGGVCIQSGGGGGGNGGAGGRGGNTADIDGSRPYGGQGGGKLLYSLIDRLTMGGGGGAGHGTESTGTPGGAGGGIIFIRAGELHNLISTANITASGAQGGSSSLDGASGGGAGGDIYLRVARNITCVGTAARISVNGGPGGSSSVAAYVGPGGGGGAGRILLQAASNGCNTSLVGASPGSQVDPSAPGGSSYGAQPGVSMTVDLLSSAFAPPAPPGVTAPGNNTSTNNVRPPITGTARANASVYVYVDGKELGPVSSDADGNWSLTLLADLSAGPHQVQAVTEYLGVRSAPSAVTNFTVDLTVPETFIVSGPPSPTSATSATFDFNSNEPGVTYECKRDTETTFTACADPATFTGLGDGVHTLEVRARDAAGNVDPTPEPYSWTVDTTPPTISIVSAPSGTTRETSATFDFDSNEAGTPPGVTYLCKLDTEADFTPCPDPKTYTGLGEGGHTLQVLAEDAAGNRSETLTRNWTVDLTAPNDTVITSGPTGPTRSTSATFEFNTETPEPGVTFQCKLDTEADFTPCTSPRTYTNLGQGGHTLQVRAVDAAGNVDTTPASRTWTVDTVAPPAPVVSPALDGTFDTLTPAITGTAEPGSTVTVIIDGQVVGTVKADASGNWSYTPGTPLTVGPHEVKARATDEAGNTSPDSTGRSFTIVQDTSAPETTITSGPSGTTSEHSATFEFNANEPGVTYECSLDGAAFTPCTSPVTYTNLGEGEHTFQVRARDGAGNVEAEPATRTWTVQDEAPTDGGDISFRGDGFGCSATGGDASLVLMGLGTFLALARRRRR